jgi:cytochrome c oxidase subunit IV
MEPITHEKRHAGLTLYVLVWGGLLLLTVLTYVLSRAPLGSFHVPVALTIAGVKSALVLAFFMHLKDHPAINRAYLMLAVLLVALLASLLLADAATRFPSANPSNAPIEGSQAGPQERALPRQ